MDTFLGFCRGCTELVGTTVTVLMFLIFSPLLLAILVFGFPIFCLIGLFVEPKGKTE